MRKKSIPGSTGSDLGGLVAPEIPLSFCAFSPRMATLSPHPSPALRQHSSRSTTTLLCQILGTISTPAGLYSAHLTGYRFGRHPVLGHLPLTLDELTLLRAFIESHVDISSPWPLATLWADPKVSYLLDFPTFRGQRQAKCGEF